MMSRKERMTMRAERQAFWNNVLNNIYTMQDEVEGLLNNNPSCLEKTTPQKDLCENIKSDGTEVYESAKEAVSEIFKVVENKINEFKASKEEVVSATDNTEVVASNAEVIDIEPISIKDVEPEKEVKEEIKEEKKEEENPVELLEVKEEDVVVEEKEEIKTAFEPVVKQEEEKKEEVEKEPVKTNFEPVAKQEEEKKEEVEKEPVKTNFEPVVKQEEKVEIKTPEENKTKEEPKEEVYEFNPVRAQTELMALNKLQETRAQFDHQMGFVNHMKAVETIADATRNLVVAWAASKGYMMFDTTAPIYGRGEEEFKPYIDRLQFLYEQGEINAEQYKLLKRRVERHPRWDYYSLIPELTGVEELFDRYFYREYPWSTDDEKLYIAMKKAMQVNVDYLMKLKKKQR